MDTGTIFCCSATLLEGGLGSFVLTYLFIEWVQNCVMVIMLIGCLKHIGISGGCVMSHTIHQFFDHAVVSPKCHVD